MVVKLNRNVAFVIRYHSDNHYIEDAISHERLKQIPDGTHIKIEPRDCNVCYIQEEAQVVCKSNTNILVIFNRYYVCDNNRYTIVGPIAKWIENGCKFNWEN